MKIKNLIEEYNVKFNKTNKTIESNIILNFNYNQSYLNKQLMKFSNSLDFEAFYDRREQIIYFRTKKNIFEFVSNNIVILLNMARI